MNFNVFRKTIEDKAKALGVKKAECQKLLEQENGLKKKRLALKAEIQLLEQEVRRGAAVIVNGPKEGPEDTEE